MAEETKPRSSIPGSFRFLLLLHQLLLSITCASSAAFVLLVKLYRGVISTPFPSGSTNYLWYWYLFLRAGARLNSVLGQEPPKIWEITKPFLTAVLLLGVPLFLGINAAARTRYARLVLDPIAGIFLFALFPLGVVLLPNLEPYEPSGPTGLFTLLSLLVVAIIAGIIYLTRTWIFPAWVGFPVAAYCAFFVWVYFGRYSWVILRNVPRFDFLIVLFFLVGTSAVTVWILFARAVRQGRMEVPLYPWRRLLLPNIPLVVLCLIPWLPARSHSVAHPKDMSSLSITLTRSSCYGTCPVYEVTIQGDGSARYEGKRFVRSKGPETIKISQASLANLLGRFDRAGFSTFDDRAFGVCFDAPHTIIGIAVDGYTKTVNIDDCYPNSRPKAGVLQLGKQIDDVLGTKQWVECEGGNCIRE